MTIVNTNDSVSAKFGIDLLIYMLNQKTELNMYLFIGTFYIVDDQYIGLTERSSGDDREYNYSVQNLYTQNKTGYNILTTNFYVTNISSYNGTYAAQF